MLNLFSLFKRLPLTRVIICGMLIVLAMVVLRRCDKKQVKEITSEQLKPGERAAIIISPNSGTIVSVSAGTKSRGGIRSTLLRGRYTESDKDTTQITSRIDGARGVRISISDAGTVSVTARTKGFCFEPGFGGYSTSGHRRIFVDSQLLFARRHGVNAGIGIGLQRPLNGVAFIAYSYNFYSNTSVLLGYDTKSEVLLGLRVKF